MMPNQTMDLDIVRRTPACLTIEYGRLWRLTFDDEKARGSQRADRVGSVAAERVEQMTRTAETARQASNPHS